MTPIWALIAINFLIFLATTIRPESIELLGISRSTFTSHPWTIVSAMFAHANINHILFNMLALYFYGMWVLGLLGEVKFLIVYFLGGLAGNALFLLLSNPYSLAVGASGAIFAIGGTLVVMRPRLKVIIFPIPIPMDLWIAILLLAVISFAPNVGWQAHLGGLAVGLAAGFYFRMRERRSFKW
jgi:membrane associated rhomboid family serine protease